MLPVMIVAPGKVSGDSSRSVTSSPRSPSAVWIWAADGRPLGAPNTKCTAAAAAIPRNTPPRTSEIRPSPRYIPASATKTTSRKDSRRSGRTRYGARASASAATTAALATGKLGPLPLRTTMPSSDADRVPRRSFRPIAISQATPPASAASRAAGSHRAIRSTTTTASTNQIDPSALSAFARPFQAVRQTVDDVEEVGVDVRRGLRPQAREHHAERADDHPGEISPPPLGPRFLDCPAHRFLTLDGVHGRSRMLLGRWALRRSSPKPFRSPSPRTGDFPAMSPTPTAGDLPFARSPATGRPHREAQGNGREHSARLLRCRPRRVQLGLEVLIHELEGRGLLGPGRAAESSIKALTNPTTLTGDKSDVTNALDQVKSDADALRGSAKSDLKPQVDALQSAIDQLKTAVGKLGNGSRSPTLSKPRQRDHQGSGPPR